jgi:hypothetical protein
MGRIVHHIDQRLKPLIGEESVSIIGNPCPWPGKLLKRKKRP